MGPIELIGKGRAVASRPNARSSGANSYASLLHSLLYWPIRAIFPKPTASEMGANDVLCAITKVESTRADEKMEAHSQHWPTQTFDRQPSS